MAGLLVVATLLITGVLCGLKFRMRSKSANISNSLDFGKAHTMLLSINNIVLHNRKQNVQSG